MTWFIKAAVFCATILLLGFTLEVLGYTLMMCQRDCKAQPDDPVCGRWNYTTEDQARRFVSRYRWLRNECERKCFQHGIFARADMVLCTKDGQNHTTYLCDEHKDSPKVFRRCIRNESLYQDYE